MPFIPVCAAPPPLCPVPVPVPVPPQPRSRIQRGLDTLPQLITNGGVFLANLANLLHPTPLTLTTPAELQPYGWTTTDLWSAPLVTAIYATLTHPQPFWADLHAVLAGVLGGGAGAAPLDPETARAACALVLAVLFASRTARTFGLVGTHGASWACALFGVASLTMGCSCRGEDQDELRWHAGRKDLRDRARRNILGRLLTFDSPTTR